MKNGRGREHPFFQGFTKEPRVIAHRGGAGEWPGETIYAFEQAVKLRVDILEMDIRYTADDKLVLMHNASVKDTTGEDRKIKQIHSDELKDLKKFDAAKWWKVSGYSFPPGAKLHVPLLEEVFETFHDQRMVVEIKPVTFRLKHVRELVRLIQKYELEKKVLVASGWSYPLDLFRHICPEVATSASVSEMIAFRYLRLRPTTTAIQTISRIWKFERINAKFIKRARDAGYVVDGWTVNHAEEMGRLIKAGIDGIITDQPSTLMRILN